MTIGPPVGNHTVGNGGRVTILDHDGAVGLFHAKFVFWWIQYHPGMFFGWADAEKHPWVVLNPPEDEFGVKKTNSAVVIKNGDPPTIAYGMVADWGPYGHLGEVSRKMMDDLN